MRSVEEPEVEIRPPRWMRWMYVIVGIPWVAFGMSGVVAGVRAGAWFFAVALGGALAAGAIAFWRMVTLAVIGDEQGLTVRGLWKSERIPPEEIEGFQLGRWRRATVVYVLVRGHSEIRLEATTLPSILDVFGASDDERFSEHLRRLEMWLGRFK